MVEPEQVAGIVKSLTKAQRDWIAAMPTIPVAYSSDDWDAMPPLYVERGDPDLPDIWFGAASAHYHGDGGPWMFSARLNETGLAVRSALISALETKP